MEVLKSAFGGWWGPIVVGIVLVLVEYFIIKPLVERSASHPFAGYISGANQTHIRTGKQSKVHVDNSRTIIIKHVTRDHHETPPFHGSRATSVHANDNDDLWLYLSGGFAAILAGAWLVARYASIISNVMLGVSVGSATIAILLTAQYRRSPVPLLRWVFITLMTAAAMVFGVRKLNTATFKGVSLADASATVHNKGLMQGVSALREAYSFEVLEFLALQLVGAVVLILMATIVAMRLLGALVATAALDNPDPQPWHARLVTWLYPSGSFVVQLIVLAALAGFALTLVSGAMWSRLQDLPGLENLSTSSFSSVSDPIHERSASQ
ncbi:MAG: hypothetical protein L0H79_16950 [Intrasporangium sp.]|uniref:hypothetical protein n=1 Tax=Intrasporangium sp. TaxID=1925024 RepID=UPI0026499B53|nr:hypothetical protein [Intrasporangium sp.]MDN5797424.1 hypothetical protein [Intrasporangium sp.]